MYHTATSKVWAQITHYLEVLINILIYASISLPRRDPNLMKLTEMCMQRSGPQTWLHMGIFREV